VTALATVVVAAAATGLATAIAVRPVLVGLTEPADVSDKVAYRSLVAPSFVVLCGVLATTATALAWLSVASSSLPLWIVLSSCGVLLAAIDARTTWLPLGLTRATWLLMTVGACAGSALGGGWPLLIRTGIGAMLAGTVYFVGWLITRGGFGYGDVRYAPVLGAATAADSWPLLLWALLAGTVVGGLHGMVRLAKRRSGPFPYAPSMLAGAYLAVAGSWLYT
jgi:leader peptidase (prepilin peptidase)/N-methyltransferase